MEKVFLTKNCQRFCHDSLFHAHNWALKMVIFGHEYDMYRYSETASTIRINLLFVDEEMRDELAGSTAVVVLVKNNRMYCVSTEIFCKNLKIKITFLILLFARYNITDVAVTICKSAVSSCKSAI